MTVSNCLFFICCIFFFIDTIYIADTYARLIGLPYKEHTAKL
jgi:hypothetical protein